MAAVGKRVTGLQVVNVVPGQRDPADRTRGVVVVAGADPVRRAVELIARDCQVVNGVVANGQLHTVASGSAPDLVSDVVDVVGGSVDGVGYEAVVAVSPHALIDGVADDVAER